MRGMKTTKPDLTKPQAHIFSVSSAALAADFGAVGEDTTAARTFSGVAYSGEIVKTPWYDKGVIFDLSTTTAPAKMPMLIEHDRSQRCGVGNVAISRSVTVSGNLLSNEHGTQVANDADEGFPWQLSVHIQPEHVDYVEDGKTETVNGIVCGGGCAIFRNNLIREISFTPTGADSATGAQVYSIDPNAQIISIGENMNIEQLQTQNADLETRLAAAEARATQAEAGLAEVQASARTDAVKQMFKACGLEFNDTAAKPYMDMAQDAFSAVSTQMQQFAAKKAPAAHLFGEQATDGQATTGAPSALMANANARAKS